MVAIDAKNVCVKCSGTGKWPTDSEYDCDRCGGDGVATGATQKIDVGELYNDISAIKAMTDNMPASGVFYSYQVFDVTDIGEYNALSDNQKATFKLIVSCGMVNLNDGPAKTALQAMFDSESTTRANYITLIG